MSCDGFSWYCSQTTTILFGFLTVFLLYKRKWYSIYCKIATIPRDVHLVWSVARLTLQQIHVGWKKTTILDFFYKHLEETPSKIAFQCEDTKLTFKQADEWSNQVARYLQGQGIKKGDTVAIFLENCVEFPCMWMGVAKLGGISALVNTNLTGTALLWCLEASKAQYIIYGTELTKAFDGIEEKLKDHKLMHLGSGKAVQGSQDFRKSISGQSKAPVRLDNLKISDTLLYIYTSGTTGLPKAAVIPHTRYLMMTTSMQTVLNINKDDVIYDPLPLYHSSGGIIGIGLALVTGCTVVIRKKFSATNYFKDCAKYNCTIGQYVGEMCRYVLTTPESSSDKNHKVRMVIGNGMRPQVWEGFVKRFNIQQVGEFYGSTEGNTNILNAWNKIGAVGYIPWFARRLHPVYLIRVDEETNEPVRGPDGLCIPCQSGEPGLVVGKIIKKRNLNNFQGYADKAATEKKILKDVFAQGDSFFNSGDILIEDDFGYFYFKDRTGDTFRWRGENVSTSEVEGIISNILGQKDAAVYGVQIPNVEGRAGMAAIVDPNNEVNLEKLGEGLRKDLAPYARPLFIRLMNNIPTTGTFKIQKNKLQKEGYNPKEIEDPLYFYDQKANQFIKLDDEMYYRVITNEIKL